MDSPVQGNDTPLDPELTNLFVELERRLGSGSRRLTLRRWMDCAESWRILEALRECRGNRSAAARALGIGRRTLYTKMDKLGIQPTWGAAPAAPRRNGAGEGPLPA
jgi:DNA-binding NtrC family response regulator